MQYQCSNVASLIFPSAILTCAKLQAAICSGILHRITSCQVSQALHSLVDPTTSQLHASPHTRAAILQTALHPSSPLSPLDPFNAFSPLRSSAPLAPSQCACSHVQEEGTSRSSGAKVYLCGYAPLFVYTTLFVDAPMVDLPLPSVSSCLLCHHAPLHFSRFHLMSIVSSVLSFLSYLFSLSLCALHRFSPCLSCLTPPALPLTPSSGCSDIVTLHLCTCTSDCPPPSPPLNQT